MIRLRRGLSKKALRAKLANQPFDITGVAPMLPPTSFCPKTTAQGESVAHGSKRKFVKVATNEFARTDSSGTMR